MKIRRRLRIEDRFDHEDKLRARFSTVDYRRRVLRFRRDVAHFPDEWVFYAIYPSANFIAIMNRADARLRNKRAHLDVLRRQKHYDRFASGDPFALAKQRVVNQTRLRRCLFFLVETPVRLIKPLPVLISSGTRSIQILKCSHAAAEKFFLSSKLRF